MSKLKVDQWDSFGHELGLSTDDLKSISKKRSQTVAIFLIAKTKNIDLKWKEVVLSLVTIKEYKMAEYVCKQHGEII